VKINAKALPTAGGYTYLWAYLDSLGVWPGALGHALANSVWLSGVPGPLGYSVGPLGLVVLGLLSGRQGPGVAVGCRTFFPGGLCPIVVGALSGFLCCLLGGYVVFSAVG